jgi:hypothetical protein
VIEKKKEISDLYGFGGFLVSQWEEECEVDFDWFKCCPTECAESVGNGNTPEYLGRTSLAVKVISGERSPESIITTISWEFRGFLYFFRELAGMEATRSLYLYTLPY